MQNDNGLRQLSEQEKIERILSLERQVADLTDRVASMRRPGDWLAQNQAFMDTITTAMPGSTVAVYDHALRLHYVSGALLPALGLSRTDVEGRLLGEVLSDADYAAVQPYFAAALEGKRLDFEHILGNGDLQHVHLSPIYTRDGTVQSGLVVSLFQRQSAAMQAAEANAYQWLEAAPVPMGIVDFETGQMVFVNQQALDYYNADRDSLVGSQFADYFHNPLTVARMYRDLERHGRLWSREIVLRMPGGTEHTVLFSAQLTYYRGRRAVIGGFVDITQRVFMETMLREREQILQNVVSNLPALIFAIDANQKILLTGGQALSALGATPGQNVGRSILELYPGDHEFLMDTQLVLDGQPIERERIAGDRVFQTNYVPLFDARGAVTGALGMGVDITDRVVAEQREREVIAEREKKRVITNFVRDVSHEFRTPLTVINSTLFILRKAIDDPARIFRGLDRIQEESDAILRLVDALLVMARLDGDMPMLDWEIDVNEIMRQVAGDVAEQREAREQQIVFDLQPGPPVLSGDPDLIELAIAHLLENAIRFTPEGGKIIAETRFNDTQLFVTIVDSGPGVPVELQKRVFERFYRGDDAHSTRGFGLGLPIARSIAEHHGGTLTLDSMPGEGSAFTLAFPLT